MLLRLLLLLRRIGLALLLLLLLGIALPRLLLLRVVLLLRILLIPLHARLAVAVVISIV